MSIVLDLRIQGDEMRFEVHGVGLTETMRNAVVLEPATVGNRRGTRATVHAIGTSITDTGDLPGDRGRFVEVAPFGLQRLDADVAFAVVRWLSARAWKVVHPGVRGRFAFDQFDLRFALPSWLDYSLEDREPFLGAIRASSLLGDLTINRRHLMHQTRLRRILGRPPALVDGGGGLAQN